MENVSENNNEKKDVVKMEKDETKETKETKEKLKKPLLEPLSNEYQRKIKQLVLSGGTVWGFSMVGILQEAICTGFLHMDDIEYIYASSVGSIIGVAFALKIEPRLIRDYFVKRPWEAICKKNRHSILDVYDGKGIIHRGFLESLFTPLLKSVELSIETTLAELYEYNKIEMHIYTTELNRYELVDISFKTHPEWTVIDTIYASCSIPLLFSPLIKDDKCYIDGGFFLNYPITKCIAEDPKEVLGISMGNYEEEQYDEPITQSSNIFDLIFTILFKVSHRHLLFKNDNSLSFPYQIVLKNKTTLEYFIDVLYKKEERERLVVEGNQTFCKAIDDWFS